MPNWSVQNIEYSSTRWRPGPGVIQPLWHVNDRQLTIGTMRATLARNAGRPARRFTAAMVRPTLRFMLDWMVGIPLSAHPLFFGALRDFSVTSRIGELAQGVAYSFWHWNRNYLLVTDYVGWAPTVGIALPANGRAPDYVMLNPLTGDFALMEAKGTMGAHHSSSMSNAMQQCNAGLAACMAQRAFACVLRLNRPATSGAGPAVPATFHYRDPAQPVAITSGQRHELFRRSYATWFDLTGDVDLADWCRHPLRHRERPKDYLDRALGLKPVNIEDPLRGAVAEAFGFDGIRARFTLEARVAESLRDPKAFEKIDWHAIIERADRERGDGIRVRSRIPQMRFPDGTAILAQ